MVAAVVARRAIIASLVSVGVVVVLELVATARRGRSRSRSMILVAIVASAKARRALEGGNIVGGRNRLGLRNGVLKADGARCNGFDGAQVQSAARGRLRIGVLGRRVVGTWSRSGTRGHRIALLSGRVSWSTEAWLPLGWCGCRGSLLGCYGRGQSAPWEEMRWVKMMDVCTYHATAPEFAGCLVWHQPSCFFFLLVSAVTDQGGRAKWMRMGGGVERRREECRGRDRKDKLQTEQDKKRPAFDDIRLCCRAVASRALERYQSSRCRRTESSQRIDDAAVCRFQNRSRKGDGR